jgi:molybdopterin-guanine dinucleotide biosynthesis protein A
MRTGRPQTAAAILAGGASSRWGGHPKGLVQLPGGLSIIERTIRVAADSGIHDIAIVANDPAPYLGFGRQVVPDLRPGLGALGGIEAALDHYAAACDGVLVLPCDLPGMTVREVHALQRCFTASAAPVVVAETGDSFWQPLCAIVSPDVLPAVSDALDVGSRGV